MRGFGDYADDDTFSAIKSRDWKDHTDLVVDPTIYVLDRASFNQGENAKYEPVIEESTVMPSLVARGPHAVAENKPADENPVLMRMREGKDGGGKGPLLSDSSLTLAQSNDQTLFQKPEPVNKILAFDTQFGSNANVFEDVSPTLKASQQSPSIGYEEQSLDKPEPVTFAKSRRAQSHHAQTFIAHNQPLVVRRLTPLECERLMGWPDNHTAEGVNGKVSDTQRYRMCGNGVASPVAKWVGEQIMKVGL
jgi:site-specific DNA-cytosine methylase